jgi:peroxiredoxin
LHRHDEKIRELGAELVAISPQLPEKNAEVKEKHKLEYPVVSDPGNQYARELGLAFSFPDDLRAVYEGFGIALPNFNGDDSWQLPLPTRIVVDAGGVIRNLQADPDYTHRPEPEETIEALRELVSAG